MYSVKMIAEEFDLSRHQVRHRLELLKPLLGDSLQRLEDKRLALSDEGIAIFRRFMKLDVAGMTFFDALRLLEKSMGGSARRAPAIQQRETDALKEMAAKEQLGQSLRLLARINELEEQLAQRVHEVKKLREQLNSSGELVKEKSHFLSRFKRLVVKH